MMFDFFGRKMRRIAQEKETREFTESLRGRVTSRDMWVIEESAWQSSPGACVSVVGGGGFGGSGGVGRVTVKYPSARADVKGADHDGD